MFSVPRLSVRHYLSLAFVICLAGLILTGCDSNPSSSGSDQAAATSTTTTPATTSASTSTLYGSLLDLSTGKQISPNSNAILTVTLYKDGKYFDSRIATNKNFYSFTDIPGGIYYVIVSDSKSIFETYSTPITLAANVELAQNFSLSPVPGASSPLSSYTVIGKLVNSVDQTPVMFANVSFGVGALTTSTLEDGSFILYGISEGKYTITFSKTGFADLQITLIASTTQVFNGLVAATNGTVRDGAGNNVAGKSIGTIAIGPAVAANGALSGVLRNPANNQLLAVGTTVSLWYKPNNADTTQPAIIYRPQINAGGYLSVENLPPGYYAITSTDTVVNAVFNNKGDLINYTFIGAAIYTGAYYQVNSGATTVLVSDGL